MLLPRRSGTLRSAPGDAMQKVLVVDDNALICELVMNFLGEWHATEVHAALDGRRAARKLQANSFDLALINATLPGLSGIHLGQIAACQETPALLMSGHPAVSDDLDRFGFPYLQKPFTLGQLLKRSRYAIADASGNIRQIKQSTIRLQASMEQMKQIPAHTKTVLEQINPANQTPWA